MPSSLFIHSIRANARASVHVVSTRFILSFDWHTQIQSKARFFFYFSTFFLLLLSFLFLWFSFVPSSSSWSLLLSSSSQILFGVVNGEEERRSKDTQPISHHQSLLFSSSSLSFLFAGRFYFSSLLFTIFWFAHFPILSHLAQCKSTRASHIMHKWRFAIGQIFKRSRNASNRQIELKRRVPPLVDLKTPHSKQSLPV